MVILFTIIIFHLLAILAGRNLRELDLRGVTLVIMLTLLLVFLVLYKIFTIENPEFNN